MYPTSLIEDRTQQFCGLLQLLFKSEMEQTLKQIPNYREIFLCSQMKQIISCFFIWYLLNNRSLRHQFLIHHQIIHFYLS